MKTLYTIAILIIFSITANAQPRLIRVLGQLYSATGNWEDSSERLLSYNTQWMPYQHIINFTNNTTSWQPDQKQLSNFNSTGQITQTDIYNWDNTTSVWESTPTTTIGYNYNTASKLELTTWDYNNTTVKDSFIYNTSGQLTERQSATQKTFYTYNTSGQLTETLYQRFINSAWENSYRLSHTYNTSGVLTEETYDYWDAANSAWYADIHFRNTYSYNTDGTLDILLKEHLNGSTWQNFERYLHFYSTTMGIKKQETNNLFTVYPNPSAGEFTIISNFDATPAIISVYDLAGRQLLTHNTNAENEITVDLSSFAKGIYTIMLQTDNGVQAQKISIK